MRRFGMRVYGISESARALHSKFAQTPKNDRNIINTLLHQIWFVQRMCAHCALLKIKTKWNRDVERLRKRRKETTAEWVTVCSCVSDSTRREKKRKSGTNLRELRFIVKSQRWIAVSHANQMEDQQIQLGKPLNNQTDRERVFVCAHAHEQTQPCIRRFSWVNIIFRNKNKSSRTNTEGYHSIRFEFKSSVQRKTKCA